MVMKNVAKVPHAILRNIDGDEDDAARDDEDEGNCEMKASLPEMIE